MGVRGSWEPDAPPRDSPNREHHDAIARLTQCEERHAQPASPPPRWSAEAQELWLGKKLIKRFVRPAVLVGAVLDDFERRGWAHCIANPFAGQPRAKARLRLARKLLNRYQGAIRFHCTGDGMHLTWEWR